MFWSTACLVIFSTTFLGPMRVNCRPQTWVKVHDIIAPTSPFPDTMCPGLRYRYRFFEETKTQGQKTLEGKLLKGKGNLLKEKLNQLKVFSLKYLKDKQSMLSIKLKTQGKNSRI